MSDVLSTMLVRQARSFSRHTVDGVSDLRDAT